MLTKKTMKMLSAAMMFALAGPALADPPRWVPDRGYHAAPRKVVIVEHRHHYRPVRTVIVERPVYVAPRPAVYIAPTPVVYHRDRDDYGPAGPDLSAGSILGTLGGAAIGAAVGSQIGQGRGNTAAIAVGAVVGGMIGSGL